MELKRAKIMTKRAKELRGTDQLERFQLVSKSGKDMKG